MIVMVIALVIKTVVVVPVAALKTSKKRKQ